MTKEYGKWKSPTMHEWLETEPEFLNWIVTSGDLLFFECDSETKRQSEEFHTPQSPRQKRHLT